MAIAGFQLAYGAAVFVITRYVYYRQPTTEATSVNALQDVTPNLPHDLPRQPPEETSKLLPGSERFTVEDARQMVAAASPGGEPVSSADSGSTPEKLAHMADMHFREGRFEEAAVDYARLLEQLPHSVDVHNNLGLTLHYVDRSSEAVIYLEKGIALDSGNQRIWLTLGFVQQNRGNLPAARRALTKAVELGPDSRVGREARRLLGELPE